MNVTDLVTLHDRVGSHLPPNWPSSFDAEQNSLIVYQLHSQPVQEGATIINLLEFCQIFLGYSTSIFEQTSCSSK